MNPFAYHCPIKHRAYTIRQAAGIWCKVCDDCDLILKVYEEEPTA